MLSEEDIKHGLRRIILEGLASQSMESLTTSIFLVGIALYYNASNTVIGLLGAIPFLSNLLQIPAIYLIDTYRNRQLIVAFSCFISRSFLLVIALTPFFLEGSNALHVIIICTVMRYAIGAIATCAWNSWMRDLVPREILGKFFSKRLFYISGLAIILTVTAASFIDWWKQLSGFKEITSYSILFGFGFTLGMISAYMILSIPHPSMPSREVREYEKHIHIIPLIQPFYDMNFRKLMLFLLSWGFAINLAAPFFTVYMLKSLQYDMRTVIEISVLSQIVYTLFLRIWGKYVDFYSNKTVLHISGTLFIFCILGWVFASFSAHYMLSLEFLIVLHVAMGISTAGVTLSSSNIALKLAPPDNATPYLAVNSLLSSLAAGIAPLIGGAMADYLAHKQFTITFSWHNSADELVRLAFAIKHWDMVFLLSFILGLYSLRRLLLVQEEGELSSHMLIREMFLDSGRILHSISTVAGLRALTTSPFAVMVNLLRRGKRPERIDREVP